MILPLVLLVVLVAVEIAVAARAQLEVVGAAREGARQAATSPEPERAVAAVRAALDAPHASRARVSVRREHVVGGLAEVEVAVPHRVIGFVFDGFEITLTSRAVMRVER